MSGFGTPERTATPRLASANGASVPGTILPFLARSSIPSGLAVIRSAGPLASLRSSAAPASWSTVTLCPLARENAFASSVTPGVAPWLVSTMSSAATAACAEHASAPTMYAVANFTYALMTSSRFSLAGSNLPLRGGAYAVLRHWTRGVSGWRHDGGGVHSQGKRATIDAQGKGPRLHLNVAAVMRVAKEPHALD